MLVMLLRYYFSIHEHKILKEFRAEYLKQQRSTYRWVFIGPILIGWTIRIKDENRFRWRAEPEIEDLTYGLNGHLQAEQHKDLPRNAQVRIT